MITIEHALNHVRVYSSRGCEFKPSGLFRSYLIGNEPPNYPVPAIMYYVAWDKDKDKLIALRWYH